MVSSSYNTTRITTIRSRSNFAHVKEQKHECNNPFFDRKIENATEGLKLESSARLSAKPESPNLLAQ